MNHDYPIRPVGHVGPRKRTTVICHKPRNVPSLQMQQAEKKGKTMKLHCGPKRLYFLHVKNEHQVSQERPYGLLSKKRVLLLSRCRCNHIDNISQWRIRISCKRTRQSLYFLSIFFISEIHLICHKCVLLFCICVRRACSHSVIVKAKLFFDIRGYIRGYIFLGDVLLLL